ncbi:MAG: AI-2E family transporter [Clostridia bacterium]|nr:AI-2E family transporter [Clostridia bacterium]
MKFFRPSRRYTTVAIYACAVSALAMLVVAAVMNISVLTSWLQKIGRILTPVLLGFLFAYILNPLVKLFEKLLTKMKMKRSSLRRFAAILLTLVLLSLVLFLFVYVIVPLVIGDTKILGQRLHIFATNGLAALTEWVKNLGFEITIDTFRTVLEQYWNRIVAYMTSFGAGLLTFSYQFIIGVALSAPIIYHKEHIRACVRQFMAAIFPAKACVYVERVADYTNTAFSKYLVGKIFEAAIVGVLNTVFYYIFGVPYPMIIAIIMTVTDLIPAIGPWLGGIPCALLICTADPWRVIAFVLVSLVIQQVDANLVAPKILGEAVGLNGMWILISISIGGGLFGIPGMLLSVPVFSVFYMILRDFANARLAKKGHTTDTAVYKDLFASRASHRGRRVFFPFLRRKKHLEHNDDETV